MAQPILNELKDLRLKLLDRLARVSFKKFVLFRQLKLKGINRRLDSLDRVIAHLERA